MEIDGFQLLNLISNRVPFLLFDTRPGLFKKSATEEVEKLLSERHALSFRQCLLKLENEELNKSQPVVIFHVWDWAAKNQVKTLERLGYLNACYLKGGLRGLEKHLEDVKK